MAKMHNKLAGYLPLVLVKRHTFYVRGNGSCYMTEIYETILNLP